MKNFLPSVVYGLLFAIWTSSIFIFCDFAISTFQGIAPVKIYSDTLAVFLAAFVFVSMLLFEAMSMIDRRNQQDRERLEQERRDREKRNHPPQI